jgi:uncharacterized membrane protein
LRFARPPHSRDELNGLRTRKQISLFIERENARQVRAERRTAEARVRHMNFELVTRIVLLILAVGIGISVIVGVLGNPSVLELSVLAASVWGAIAAALLRLLRPRSS